MYRMYRYIMYGLGAFFLLAACDRTEKSPFAKEDACMVYMSFKIGLYGKEAVARRRGKEPSVANREMRHGEDAVRKLALLVFEAADGGAKVVDEYTSSLSFVIKIEPGNYDFYFIANYSAADTQLKSMTKAQIDTYLQTLTEFTSSSGAENPNMPFPMARVYRNQQITNQGGTQANPTPFRPNLAGYAKQLEPVSLFGEDWQGATTQNTINLIRACAKISLRVGGAGTTNVDKIEYVNAAKNYTFAQLAGLPSREVADNLSFSFSPPTGTDGIVSCLYVPERLFPATEQKGWRRDKTTGVDEPIGKVNYLQINTKGGQTYKIPVVSNGPAEGYLYFARNNKNADYNIIRNNRYHYDITIPADEKEIVVHATILPWTPVESEISFREAEYANEITFPAGGGEFAGEKTALLHQQSVAKVSFKLLAPVGARWRASLTNGIDFNLEEAPDAAGEKGALSGIADPQTTYTLYVRPLKPFVGESRSTEFYIVVNEEEVQLVPRLKAAGVPSEQGKRWVFKQIE